MICLGDSMKFNYVLRCVVNGKNWGLIATESCYNLKEKNNTRQHFTATKYSSSHEIYPFFHYRNIVPAEQLEMGRYECLRTEQFLNAENSKEIGLTFVVVQKRGNVGRNQLGTHLSFYLVPSHGSTITPARCTIIKSQIPPENLQQIVMNLCRDLGRNAIPDCASAAEKLLQELKNNYIE